MGGNAMNPSQMRSGFLDIIFANQCDHFFFSISPSQHRMYIFCMLRCWCQTTKQQTKRRVLNYGVIIVFNIWRCDHPLSGVRDMIDVVALPLCCAVFGCCCRGLHAIIRKMCIHVNRARSDGARRARKVKWLEKDMRTARKSFKNVYMCVCVLGVECGCGCHSWLGDVGETESDWCEFRVSQSLSEKPDTTTHYTKWAVKNRFGFDRPRFIGFVWNDKIHFGHIEMWKYARHVVTVR